MLTYRRIDPATLALENDHGLLQAVYEHVRDILGDRWHPVLSIEQLADASPAVKTAWYVSSNPCRDYRGHGIYRGHDTYLGHVTPHEP